MLLATGEIRTIWFRQYSSWICIKKKSIYGGKGKKKKVVLPQPRAFNQGQYKAMMWRWPGKIISVSSTGEVYSELYLWRSTRRPAIRWPRGKEAKLRVPRADRGDFWFVQVECRLVPSTWPKSYYERSGSRGGNDQGSICDLLMEPGGMVRDRDVPWFFPRGQVSD
ncbi:hypothetical protein BDW42DRAFT_142161 [Aspergillus taichungensis]|uniref:Uncharacterized protein n=1 Tax=Aspergillus taichungensis TaxID=482145 RepID=A0A2J5I6R5_9EURO|nr:hypothetical protein BDW42DRAFT_142161 [Aspergillus taichungensis]